MNEIKALRAKTGLSQAKFADLFGMPHSLIRDWEQGHRNPKPYIIELIKQSPVYNKVASK